MNGRCENDALDAAIDVCEECGGEYCSSCLVFPGGRKKPPLCKICAIANSGVRMRAKRERVQPKSEARKRRKELRKAQEEQVRARVVHVEDLPDFNFEPPHEIAADSKTEKRRRLRRRGESDDHQDSPTDEAASLEEQADQILAMTAPQETRATNPNSASRLLDEIRDGAGLDRTGAGDVWNFPTEVGPTESELDPKWLPLSNPDASNPFDDPEMGRVERSPREIESAFPAPDLNAGPLSVDLESPRARRQLEIEDSESSQPRLTAPAFEEEDAKARSEDTDAAGNWIPPNLRGIVPESERQTVLPKRRRTTD